MRSRFSGSMRSILTFCGSAVEAYVAANSPLVSPSTPEIRLAACEQEQALECD
jgi:hypothetical protein